MTTPTPLERSFHYMRAFEVACLAGDWSVLDSHFAETAVHEIEGGGPMGGRTIGRDAVTAGLRGGADREALEAAIGRSLVRCYGAAKSEQDTGAALALCSEDFSIDTLAFGIASRDRKETEQHLALLAGGEILAWSPERMAEIGPALAPYLRCFPDMPPGTWIVENVGTRANMRRRGLVGSLLDRALDRGLGRDFPRAQISCLIGNDAAQRAYEKVGFAVVEERIDPDFERTIGAPGFSRMMMTL